MTVVFFFYFLRKKYLLGFIFFHLGRDDFVKEKKKNNKFDFLQKKW